MRVLVCGGRHFDRWEVVRDVLDKLKNVETVIDGGATGADALARYYVELTPGVRGETFKADWDRFGRAAGPRRNQRMLDEGKPAIVVAFPGGRGTADMVARARQAGVLVLEVKCPVVVF